MKLLVALSCLLAVAFAKPSGVVAPVTYSNLAYTNLAAAPLTYSNIAAAPVTYTNLAAAPVTYTNVAAAAPVAYTNVAAAAPVAYTNVAAAAPVAYTNVAAAAPVAYSSYSVSTNVAAPVAAAVAAPAVAAPAVTRTVTTQAVAAPAVTRTVTTQAVAAAPVATAPVAAVAAAPVVAAPIVQKTQYHAQNELGQASYGHSEPLQTHNAVQDVAGNKVGSYSYVAPDGQVIAANYVADALGYRVASNALPVGPAAPLDTPEVVAARAAHLQKYAVAKSRSRRSVVASYVAAPVVSSAYAYAAPAAVYRPATLSTVVNTPAHAVSYRVY